MAKKLAKGLKLRQGWYHYDFMHNGVRQLGSFKTQNGYIAEQLLRHRRNELALGNLVDERKVNKSKFFRNEVVDYIKRMKPTWTPKTAEMHNTSLPKVVAYFGDMVLNQIRTRELELYRVHRSEQVTRRGTPPSNSTVNREIALVRQLLSDHDLWVRAKGNKFVNLKENDFVGRALTKDEINKLAEACRLSPSRILYPAFMLAVLTGLRRNELTKLKWRSVDLIDGKITVERSTTKSKAGARDVPLNAQALEVIKIWRAGFEALPGHFVFCRHRYGYDGGVKTFPEKSYNTWYAAWDKAREVAGVDCRWHDLRHTAASILGKFASRATMKKVLGWNNEEMLNRYCHSEKQDQQQAVQMAGTFFTEVFNQNNVSELIQ
jgi:integrase